LIGVLSYKLTDNFSIKEAGKWLNREEILEILSLERFPERSPERFPERFPERSPERSPERVLYNTLEILGCNKEEIRLDIMSGLFSVCYF